jgi:hypothetical protein
MKTTITIRKPAKNIEDASMYGPGYHEHVESESSDSVRNSWIFYMIDHYSKEFPKYHYTDWRRWAEAKVDNAINSLGDYFSFSHYENQEKENEDCPYKRR